MTSIINGDDTKPHEQQKIIIARGISLNGVASYFNHIGKFLNGEFSPTICDGQVEEAMATKEILKDAVPKNILPDMRNIDAIVEDVARKEVLLDAMLESFKQKQGIPSGIDTNNVNLCSTNDLFAESSSDSCSNNIERAPKQMFKIELEKSNLASDVLSNGTCSVETSETLENGEYSESDSGHSTIQLKELSNCDFRNEEKISSDPKNSEIYNNNIDLNADKLPEIVFDFNKKEDFSPSNKSVNGEVSMFEIDLTNEDANISQLEYNIAEAIEECPLLECKSQNIFPSVISDSSFFNGWCSMTCPDSLVSLHSFNKGIVFCNPQLKVYISSGEAWKVLNYKAEYVIPSPTGQTGLKVHCSIAYYSDKWTTGSDWKKVGKEITHAAVLDDKIWLISKGELFFTDVGSGSVSNYLSQSSLSKVYLYDQGLLFISENGRIFLLEDEDWRLIRGVKNAKLLAVGPNHLVWAVDSRNTLFVADNIKTDRPIWWQVPVGNTIHNKIVSICSTEDAIYLAFENIQSIFFNKTYVTGHQWTPATVHLECIQITAGAVFEEKGCVWVLERSNKLIALDNSLNVLKEVLPPCNVVCLASAPGALWLLSDDGSVYLRKDITDSNPVGVHWRKLNLEQLHSQVEMVGISCGPDVVWACDIRGKIIMLVGSPHSIANDTFDPAWVNVDGKPLENNTFTKVYVGPDTYMVWALDNAGNIYVREAVFPTFPLGTGWVLVPDLKASHLTISADAVYALNSDGVFKRVGISQSNYIGDAWLYLPIKLDYISASFDLGLYGICSKTRNLVSHVEREFPMSELITVEKDWALL